MKNFSTKIMNIHEHRCMYPECVLESIYLHVLTGWLWPCTFQCELILLLGFLQSHCTCQGPPGFANKRLQILSGSKQWKFILAYSTQGQLGISSHRDTGFQNINHLENYLVGNHILGSSSIVPEIIYIYNFCSYIFGQGKLKVASNF